MSGRRVLCSNCCSFYHRVFFFLLLCAGVLEEICFAEFSVVSWTVDWDLDIKLLSALFKDKTLADVPVVRRGEPGRGCVHSNLSAASGVYRLHQNALVATAARTAGRCSYLGGAVAAACRLPGGRH